MRKSYISSEFSEVLGKLLLKCHTVMYFILDLLTNNNIL